MPMFHPYVNCACVVRVLIRQDSLDTANRLRWPVPWDGMTVFINTTAPGNIIQTIFIVIRETCTAGQTQSTTLLINMHPPHVLRLKMSHRKATATTADSPAAKQACLFFWEFTVHQPLHRGCSRNAALDSQAAKPRRSDEPGSSRAD